jgi:DNA polymerase V
VTIVGAALAGLRAIYKLGFPLVKAGVILLDLQPATRVQHELDLDPQKVGQSRLMAAMDQMNDRYGQGTMMLASSRGGKSKVWSMKHERRTPAYKTNWQDVPVVRA